MSKNTTITAGYNSLIEDAIETLLNTREMCGDEKHALREWQVDNKITLIDAERFVVYTQVEKRWAAYRKQAGVSIK